MKALTNPGISDLLTAWQLLFSRIKSFQRIIKLFSESVTSLNSFRYYGSQGRMSAATLIGTSTKITYLPGEPYFPVIVNTILRVNVKHPFRSCNQFEVVATSIIDSFGQRCGSNGFLQAWPALACSFQSWWGALVCSF